MLFEFLNNVEEIRFLISCTEGTPYGSLLLRAIRKKIDGSAKEILNMYGTLLEWTSIKQNLIHHYADKRQGNKPLGKYYDEIIEISASMTNYIQIHEQDANVVREKQYLFSEMCLNAFLSDLKEPLGATIRAMKPDSLATAFANCIKEQNISYARYDKSVFRLSQNFRPNQHTTCRTHPHTSPLNMQTPCKSKP